MLNLVKTASGFDQLQDEIALGHLPGQDKQRMLGRFPAVGAS